MKMEIKNGVPKLDLGIIDLIVRKSDSCAFQFYLEKGDNLELVLEVAYDGHSARTLGL